MDDQQLLRYSRHILLPQIDIEGQQRLLESRVMIVGLGGLGSPVAMYLAASGVGKLTLVDDDAVELSNLQRQVIHSQNDLGRAKVDSAADTLRALNEEVRIETIPTRLSREALLELMPKLDAVVDCSDNFATRFLLNEVSQQTKTPLISGAAIRMEGQVTVYDANQPASPCYRCLYEDLGELDESCSESGIIATMLPIIGGIQATETIKTLLGIGESLSGRLLILDALTMQWREIKLNKNPDCPVCGSHE